MVQPVAGEEVKNQQDQLLHC